MSNKATVRAVCSACDGTGLYRGFAEAKGEAVVCLRCQGTGCEDITYTPFIKRKERSDVHMVYLSKGSLIVTGVGKCGGSVTYEAFRDGEMPK
jgi:DnaJ-class molecular chaperone